MMICLLLAQTEPLSGGAGWIGAGLLGLVLGWLLFVHLPAKDKQLKEMIDAKDKQLMDTIRGKDEHIERMAAKFEAVMNAVIRHFDEEVEAIRAYYRNVYHAPSVPKELKKE